MTRDEAFDIYNLKKVHLKTKSDDKLVLCPNFVQQQLTLYNLNFWEPIAFENSKHWRSMWQLPSEKQKSESKHHTIMLR